ncbi:hypothetical protein [Spiroplasma endosymbiont of Zeiraphera isertana]|uniref:hypothetical protein n=1 Tax=Spiroplasma endosymbiont of Zeiraphera isertana TaxID=3066313 RepID=UPI00313C8D5F
MQLKEILQIIITIASTVSAVASTILHKHFTKSKDEKNIKKLNKINKKTIKIRKQIK